MTVAGTAQTYKTDVQDGLGNTWAIAVVFDDASGRLEPIRLEIEASAPGQVLTTASIRGIPFKQVVDAHRRRLLGLSETVLADRVSRPRTKPLTVAELRQVADVYASAWHRGDPPVVAVSTALGICHSTAAKRVMKARSAGLLPATAPRVAMAGGVS